MKKIIFFQLFILIGLLQNNVKGQNIDTIYVNELSEKNNSFSFVSVNLIYPFVNDETIEKIKKNHPFENLIYPLLILNGIIVRDDFTINCFRNNWKKLKISKIKTYTQEQAKKKFDIKNIPQDGVVFVTIDKKNIVDFYQLCQ
jgi:hypothetical protein